jgi:hypothetical protein
VRQFQQQLRQQAFLNRQTLTNQNLQGSLGLAQTAQPNLAGSTAALTGLSSSLIGQTSALDVANVQAQAGSGFGVNDFANLAGGIGGVLSGIGSIFHSSRKFKDAIGELDKNTVLAAIKKLPVELWKYKGQDRVHAGTYAEDFHEGFGLGTDETISVIDYVGILTSGIQALTEKVENLEGLGLAHAT